MSIQKKQMADSQDDSLRTAHSNQAAASSLQTVEIGYLSDTGRDYSLALRKVKTLSELRDLIDYYSPIAMDALALVNKMSDADFERFLADLKKVSRAKGQTAKRITDEWGDIILPRVVLEVGLIAAQFHAPFGTAYIRMQEMGQL